MLFGLFDEFPEATQERRIRKYSKLGFSRYFIQRWEALALADTEKMKAKGRFSDKELKKFHEKGFLGSTVLKYKIANVDKTEILSDRDYLYMVLGVNDSFKKWIEETVFLERILLGQNVVPKVHFTITKRNGSLCFLPMTVSDRKADFDDVLAFVREKGVVSASRAEYLRSPRSAVIRFDAEEECYYLNEEPTTKEELYAFFDEMLFPWVVTDYVGRGYDFQDDSSRLAITFWIGNDAKESPLLAAQASVKTKNEGKSKNLRSWVNLKTGSFRFKGNELRVPNWESIMEGLLKVCDTLSVLRYFTLTIVPCGEAPYFKITHANPSPKMPSSAPKKRLRSYWRFKYQQKREAQLSYDNEGRYQRELEASKEAERIAKVARPGFRQYMYGLWESSVKDDLENTEGYTLEQKKWAHDRGFMSYRIHQYGLTEDNYASFLSDYDYGWLNRINNVYQKEINDKTSYRLIMEPFKQNLPEYYLLCLNDMGGCSWRTLPDCPEGVEAGFNGLMRLLEMKGKLAFKPSAGTHGDGFYCLALEDGVVSVNDEPTSKEDLLELVSSQKSHYIVTDFLSMHEGLKVIYPKTVNTIRVAVINEHGYDPKIVQCYMRIGASATGYTDNVGYGGICAMVDNETGRIYQPEVIVDHYFKPCPTHPDTGVSIEGIIVPCWDEVRRVVLGMAEYLGELEYLGYDVAVTDDGVKILEINIHQDLHKVANHGDDLKNFLHRKLHEKKVKFDIVANDDSSDDEEGDDSYIPNVEEAIL